MKVVWPIPSRSFLAIILGGALALTVIFLLVSLYGSSCPPTTTNLWDVVGGEPSEYTAQFCESMGVKDLIP